MRMEYLKEHRSALFSRMLTTGKLKDHLEEVDSTAYEMLEQLVTRMAKAQGITETLKAEDQMKWVGLMNNIRAAAEEIVLNDLIYS